MAYFQFACGNFTTGRGHYINNSTTPTQDIINKLEEKGERNCNVIIERYNYPSINIDKPAHFDDFSYEIKSRWYTNILRIETLTSLIGTIPIIKSYIHKDSEK